MNKDELLEMIADLDTKAEMIAFGEETFGLKFTTRDTVEQVKQKLIAAASGDEPEEAEPEPEKEPETGVKDVVEEAPDNLKGKRLLKHKSNGRIFIWSEKLAKNRNLYEVK